MNISSHLLFILCVRGGSPSGTGPALRADKGQTGLFVRLVSSELSKGRKQLRLPPCEKPRKLREKPKELPEVEG